MFLPVEAIRRYDRDPRRSRNPEHDRIKASIRADGIKQPLVVTKRPGEAGYVIGAGGNSRLRILMELFEETADERFRVVPCVCKPWSCESQVLLSHLKENDLRGELTFLDKSLAVCEAKRLIEEESGNGEVSQKKFAGILKERGYGLSQGRISQFMYTVERLLPLIPRALENGLGRPQIERIRRVEHATRALWRERSVGDESEYEEVLSVLFHRYDGLEWDVGSFCRALEGEIAERADVSVHVVSAELNARLAGRAVEETAVLWKVDADDATWTEDAKGDGDELMLPGTPKPRAETGVCAPVDERKKRSSASTLETTERAADLKSLRARAWTLASRLAARNGMGDLVEPLGQQGLGFVLRDVPGPATVEGLDEDALAQVSMVWWQLAACAEVTVAPIDRLAPSLGEGTVLRRALESQDAGLLFSAVWTLDPGHVGYRLWRRLDDGDFGDLLRLIQTYRALHQAAERSGAPLWS